MDNEATNTGAVGANWREAATESNQVVGIGKYSNASLLRPFWECTKQWQAGSDNGNYRLGLNLKVSSDQCKSAPESGERGEGRD